MVSVQANMQMHDELASLFSRNLTFNPEIQAPAPPPQEPQHEPPKPIIYSISQHYNHSAHAVRPQPTQQPDPNQELQRRSSEPPQSETSSAETLLRNHGVNPDTLTPSQVQLFRIADPPQQMRLIELWSICPPGKGADIPALAWSSTTIEHEEQLARLRYERAAQEQQIMSLDGTPVQSSDGRWLTAADASMEPYMAAGYADLMHPTESTPRQTYSHYGSAVTASNYSQATDPVYMGPDFARHQQQQQQQMEMAAQYGAFQQLRGQCDMDTMDVM